MLESLKKIFYFGEEAKGYDVRVLNEREIRAGSGVLFIFAFIAFANSWLLGNFYYTKIFVVVFLVDFSIRVFINPKYSPSLILGRMIVSNQVPEYVGAPQKRFAWFVGLILGLVILFTLVIHSVIGPINMIICLICLIFFLFESAFGICFGCKMYDLIHRKKHAEYCPGGTCEVHIKEEIQKLSWVQILIFIIAIIGIFGIFNYGVIDKDRKLKAYDSTQMIKNDMKNNEENIENKICEVPDWAIAIGHKDLWKEHHGCK